MECCECGELIEEGNEILVDGEIFCIGCAEDHGTDEPFDFGEDMEQED